MIGYVQPLWLRISQSPRHQRWGHCGHRGGVHGHAVGPGVVAIPRQDPGGSHGIHRDSMANLGIPRGSTIQIDGLFMGTMILVGGFNPSEKY